ncbi:transporter substrate-binding domain-containing protein [Marinobacter sp. MA]|uniref:substrate-binding periplasmic protein n=1 Tax=Marinobacter sp. MA TaxID=2971606 RepID=UPI003AADD12B
MAKKHWFERLSAALCRAFMVVLIALPGVSLASNNLTFAYSDKSPPYSFSLNGKTLGLLPDLVQLTFRFIPGYTTEHEVVPWARAQYNVKLGLADGLLTYPSKERKEYAVFSDKPLFTQDFGYLIYSADNPNIDLIESATSFADLSGLTVIVERGSRWEEENIPGYLEREPGRDIKAMMHLLTLREAGDFMVQPAEDARYMAQQLGYSEKLRVRQVGFIPNSRIPFHIGVSRQHPSAMDVINEVDAVTQNPEFQSELNTLIRRYR